MTNDPDGGQVLAGGVTNAGAVIRRGDLVERPAPRTAHALHAHLSALHGRGFDAAPAPVALLPGGRELLTFVPGTTALPPFPREALDEPVLTSVGRLLRRLHDTGTGIAPDPSADWPRDLADPEGGPLLCHNDVCVENVVLRDGRAAALIDFDMAAPGRPVWDFAMTARYWVPLLPPQTSAFAYPPGLDAPARLRVLADAYGLPAAERAALPAVLEQAHDVCRAFVAARLADGDPIHTRVHAERGGWARWDHVHAWLTAHRETFTDALLR